MSIDVDENSRQGTQTTIDWKDTKPFIAPITTGQVIKVYDGDTITVANRLNIVNDDTMYRFSVRLNGIDTPEIRGHTEDERHAAIIARDALAVRILHKHVEIRNVKQEKYGRLLADVYIKNENINKWLLDEGYAVKYDGGTKKSPNSWMDYRNKNRRI